MNKHMKQFICTLLAICVLAFCSSVFAIDDFSDNTGGNASILRYSHIDELGSGLTIGALGRTTCFSDVELTNSTDIGYLHMTLQRLAGGVWTDVTTWTDSGRTYVTQTENYYVSSGYYYRVYTEVYVYNSSGVFVEYAALESSYSYY